MFNWRDTKHPRAGGAEVFTQRIAEAWVHSGHSVTLFSARPAGLPASESIAGVAIRRAGSGLSVYRMARKFWENEASYAGFDIVIDEVNTRPFFAPVFVKNVPVAALIHQVAKEVWYHELPRPIAWFGSTILEQRWLRLYSTVPTITISESSRRSLRRYGLTNLHVVPPGLNESAMSATPARESVPTLLFVGRLSANKRPDHAIAAFKLVQRQLPGAQMWVVGSGPLGRTLAEMAPADVTFFGHVQEHEKCSLMEKADVLVVTSVREGWGMVVSEAASLGTPTIGYKVDGLIDSIEAAGGYLVEQSPKALADEIVRRIPDIRSRIPERRSTGTLPWSEVAERILAVGLPPTRPPDATPGPIQL